MKDDGVTPGVVIGDQLAPWKPGHVHDAPCGWHCGPCDDPAVKAGHGPLGEFALGFLRTWEQPMLLEGRNGGVVVPSLYEFPARMAKESPAIITTPVPPDELETGEVVWDYSKPYVATMFPSPVEARSRAEEQVNAILQTYDEPTLALLWTILKAAGWSTDKARLVLARVKWNL